MGERVMLDHNSSYEMAKQLLKGLTECPVCIRRVAEGLIKAQSLALQPHLLPSSLL